MSVEKQIAEVIITAIKGALKPLEARILELEQRPSTIKDAGVWKSGTGYSSGDIISHHGGGWICSAPHVSTGTTPDHEKFRLFVRSGRDARR